MNVKRGILAVLFFTILSISMISFAEAKNLEVSSVLLKVSLTKDSVFDKKVTVSSGSGGQFNAQITNISGVSLNESNFILQPGETKDIHLFFNSSLLEPGVYVGNLKVQQGKEAVFVPIIFEVESQDLFFDANLDIPSDYQEILPTGKLVVQIKLFDLTSGGTTNGLGNTKVDVGYNVYSVADGKLIVSESDSIIVNQITSLTKTISFEKEVAEGDYVASIIVKYQSSVGVSSYLFTVSKKASSAQGIFNSAEFDWKSASVLGIIILLFFGTIFLFVRLIKGRDKIITELNKHNELESQRQKKFLADQINFLEKKGFRGRQALRREAENKVKQLKIKQKKRKMELKTLVGKGDSKGMRRKLEEWKKEGYNTLPIEFKLKALSKNDMEGLMDKWEKEGYNLK